MSSANTSTRLGGLSRLAGALLAVPLLVGVTLVQNASAATRHSTISISVWSGLSGPDQTGMLNIVNSFNKSQSAINIAYRTAPFSNYGQELATAIAGGNGPEMWTLDAASDLGYITQKQQAPFDKYIKGNKVLNAKNFPGSLWKYYQWKGKQFQIPLYAVPLMRYYNKSILKKAGLKHPVVSPPSKVLSTAKKLTNAKKGIYGMVVPQTWPMQFVWPTVFAQFGGKLFNPKTKTSLVNSKAGVQALTYLRNLIYKYHVSPTQYAQDQDLSMLPKGQAAQIFDGIWEYTNPGLQTMGKDEGVAPVPSFGPHYKVFIGDLGWSLNKKNSAAVNRASVKFLMYYEKHSTAMAKVGDVPVYLPVLHKKGFAKKYPAAGAAAKELPNGVYSVRYPNYVDSYLYDDALWPVIQGKSTSIKKDLNTAAKAITNHVRHPNG